MATKSKAQQTETTAIRHGDLVLHVIPQRAVKGLKAIRGNVLASGDSTSLKHTFVPATAGKQYDLGDGNRLLRLTKAARLDHDGADGHETIKLAAGDHLVTRKRQYDREHVWTNVQD